MKNSRLSRRSNRKKIVLIVLTVVAALAFLLFLLEKRGAINLYSNSSDSSQSDNDAQTTSTAPTAQEGFTEGDDRQPGTSESEGEGSGNISDNNGNIDSSTDTSNPTVSTSGEISVYSPNKNALLVSGQEVSGLSSLGTVSYRLIDNNTGVIAMGQLSVINGRFSGTLSFGTSASEGRLDLFGTKSDGSEFSNVEIPIRFK